MDRPLSSVRPLGPVAQLNDSDDVSEFDKIEVEHTPNEETEYTVAGIYNEPTETVGLVVDTNALTVSSDGSTKELNSLSLFNKSGKCAMELLSEENQKVGIGTRKREMTEIVVGI